MSNGVLVLVPGLEPDIQVKQDADLHERVMLGRQACRVAHQQSLVPMYPLLYYGAFLTEEELDLDLRKANYYWARRVAVIWVCNRHFGSTDVDRIGLDPVAYKILADNEGILAAAGRRKYNDPSRLPIRMFCQTDAGPLVSTVTRQELDRILIYNIKDGILHGLGADADLDTFEDEEGDFA